MCVPSVSPAQQGTSCGTAKHFLSSHSSESGSAIYQISAQRSGNSNQESAIQHKQRSEEVPSLLDRRGKQ